MRQNRDNSLDVVVLGAAAVLGFFLVKALTTPSQRQGSGRRRLALPEPGQDFLVLYSQHGSEFRFEGLDGATTPPAEPYKTLSRALADAQRWELTADVIGGRAQIMNMRTGERFDPSAVNAQ